MVKPSFKCPKYGSGNEIGYKSGWKCADFGFKWILAKRISITSDKQKTSKEGSLAVLLGVGFIIAGLAALIGGLYWYFSWRSGPHALVELSDFFCLLVFPTIGIFMMFLGCSLLFREEKGESPPIRRTRFYITGLSNFAIAEIEDLPPEILMSENPLTFGQLLDEYRKKVKRDITIEEEKFLKVISSNSKIIPISPDEIVNALDSAKMRIIHGSLSLEEFALKACQSLGRFHPRIYYQIKREPDDSFHLRKVQGEVLDSFKIFNISDEVAGLYLLQILHRYGLFQPNIDSEAYILARCIVYSPRKCTRDKFYSDPNLITCASKWKGKTKRKAFWYAVGLALCAFRYGGSLFHGPYRLARGYEVGRGKGTAFKSRAQKNHFARRFAKELSEVGYLIVNGDKYQANLPYLAEKGFYDVSFGLITLSIKKEDSILKVKAQLLKPFKLTRTLSLKQTKS